MSSRISIMRLKRWSLALLPLLLAAEPTTRPAIIKSSEPNSLHLAFVTNNGADFWKLAKAGVDKYAKESGTTIDFKMPSRGRPEEQQDIVQQLLDDGYDGIAVAAIAPADEAKFLADAGTKTNIICVDSPCPDANAPLSIYTDNKAAGRAVGEHLVKLMPDGGKIAVVCGTFEAQNAKDRRDGIKEATKDHKIEMVVEVEDHADRAKSVSATSDMLTDHPEVTAVVGLWSYEGPAIERAVKDSGKSSAVTVIAFDDEPATLKAVEDGTIESTFVSDPFKMGYESAKWLHDLAINGDAVKLPEGRKICPPIRMIDKSNVADFEKQLDEMRNGQ